MSKFLTSSKDINLINGTADLNVNSITATTTNFADGGGGGGGGGGITYDSGTFEQGNGIVFRNGTDADKVKNASGFALVNLPVIGESLLCNDIQFPNVYSAETTITENKTKLTKITYDGATTTTIDGELDVDKIKNTAGTAEVELETDGKINIVGDGQVKVRANGTTNRLLDSLSLESATDCWINTSLGIYLNAFNPDNTAPNLSLNAVNGLLSIQAINGHIQNYTKGLIRLENIPTAPVVARNGFIFNPDDVRVDLNKLDVSKGYLGLNAGGNMEMKSEADLLLESGGGQMYLTSQSNFITNSLGNITLNADGGGVSIQAVAGNIQLSSSGNINFFTNGSGSVLCSDVPAVDHALTNKAYVDSKSINPFNLIIAGTDEVNTITTTGQKMEIRAPATITLNRVAFSTTQAGGVNFTVGVYQEGTLIKQMILGGLSYSDQAITPITITKGDIIHLKVINVGLSTGTGLKCYLEGVYQ